MTFPELASFIVSHRGPILGCLFLAPWMSYLLCVLIPGDREEPFILNLNLVLALGTLMAEIGYISYVSANSGLSTVVEQTEVLFLAAPIYYVGLSLWLSRQRLPLHRLPVYRVIQGIVMIVGAYLSIAWLLSRVRIYFFGRLPFSWFLVILLALVGIAYLGYQQIFHGSGQSTSSSQSDKRARTGRQHSSTNQPSSIDQELQQIQRDLKNQ